MTIKTVTKVSGPPNAGPRPPSSVSGQSVPGQRAVPLAQKNKPGPDATHGQLGGDALQAVVMRNRFYREGYQNLLKIAIAQGIVVVVLAVLVTYKVFIETPPVKYFATYDDGKIIQLLPLNKPNQTDAAVLSWVAKAATDVMTFNFLDYRQRLQDSAKYFTQPGWDGFMKALQDSRFLEGVETQQQIITAIPSQAPVIIERNVLNDRYYWRVQLPVMVTFVSGEKKQSRRQLLNLMVVQVSPLENAAGLGIEQWVASDL